jgi:pre-rRNA-processing protein IPI3
MVWDYHSGQALRTYLLPDTPTAVTLDPADRAFYLAYQDGSLQTLSFYDEMQQTTPVDVLREGSQSHRPIQAPENSRFNAESQKLGGALSLSLSWDGTTLISGHESGKVAAWDIAKSNYMSILASLPGPVTNLQFLEPTGFPDTPEPKFKIHAVVKPRQDTSMSDSGNGLVPTNYSWNMQLTGRLDVPSSTATEEIRAGKSEFEEALTHSSFPLHMLEESLAELEAWNPQSNANVAPAADFLSLSATADEGSAKGAAAAYSNEQETEFQDLKKQLASLQRIQKVTFQQLSEVREERDWLLKKEKERAAEEQRQRAKGKQASRVNGGDVDVEMSEAGSSDDASSASASESDDSDDGAEGDSDQDEESSASG